MGTYTEVGVALLGRLRRFTQIHSMHRAKQSALMTIPAGAVAAAGEEPLSRYFWC